MKILISKYAGFCDGVQRAYDIVQKASKNKRTKRPIFVRGSLVHNNDVVNRIEKLGIKKLNFNGKVKAFFDINKGKIGTLIITAHGIGPEFYKLAKKSKIKIIDTTCPKVIKVQRLAEIFSRKNYQVIIIGKKKHKEVRGIFEWSGGKAQIIDSESDLKKIKIDPAKEVAIISQTTQKIDAFNKLSQAIKKKYPKVKFFDTLCMTTHHRQKEIAEIAKKAGVVLVIGSKKSNNSVHLWEISREINPKSYFIEGVRDIKKGWFRNCQKIGISAGASTPPWIIQEVCDFLENKL